MADLIERQAVIDTVSKWFYDVFGITESDGTATIFKRLRELPSAQPEVAKDTNVLNNDCISRRQAIGALNDEYHGMISDESMKIYQIINWISALPSAQPERKTGKWIYHSNWESDGECGYECSECGMGSDVDYGYCMRCGARMDGESE